MRKNRYLAESEIVTCPLHIINELVISLRNKEERVIVTVRAINLK